MPGERAGQETNDIFGKQVVNRFLSLSFFNIMLKMCCEKGSIIDIFTFVVEKGEDVDASFESFFSK